MTAGLRLPAIVLVFAAIVAASALGWFRPVDDALRSVRYSQISRPATGEIVLVEIDRLSLDALGAWPWSRQIYADIVRQLVSAGAAEIIFDIDFSTPSSAAADEEFEAALAEAGGFAMLAAFRQPAGAGGGTLWNLPLDRFEGRAPAVLVNVHADADGRVTQYPYGALAPDNYIPSVASVLAGTPGKSTGDFVIDFSIDIAGIDQISAADVATGRIDAAQFDGKQVVIGASALELGDDFAVPRYGIVSGPLLQVLAAETLKQGRPLIPLGPIPVWLVVLAFGATAFLLHGRVRLSRLILAAIFGGVVIELSSLAGQAGFGVLFDTAAVHVALTGFVLAVLAKEFKQRLISLDLASRERDSARDVLDRVIADNSEGIVVVDVSGRIVSASRPAELIFNSGQPLRGRLAHDVLPQEIEESMLRAIESRRSKSEKFEPEPAELALKTDHGTRTISYVVTLSATRGDRSSGRQGYVACLTFRDVSDEREHERELNYLARHDPLTGALSRNELINRINKTLAVPDNREEGITVALVDLSRFKSVNDTLGHSYGDAVLKQVVARLQAMSLQTVARLGGDSFALTRFGPAPAEGAADFCRDILGRLSEPYPLGEYRAIVGASIGLTDTHVSGLDPEVLIAHADMALSAAKAQPGNSFVVFQPEMDEDLKGRQQMEVALRHALSRGELSVSFQPQVELATDALVGVEALARWHHPELGMVPPSEFIPAAEETGLIIELGRWVLIEACKEVAEWPPYIRLAVNVSPTQFEYGDVPGDVRDALEISGLAPDRLDIEITEGLLIAKPKLITQKLHQLQDLGVHIALDDFGTGYSSLGYLGQLPIDKIKIDQSFVRGLPGDQEAAAIIRAVMTLSESLGKTVVAEGIETADQAWMLRLAGCQLGQGYHFGRPLSAIEMRERLGIGTNSPPLRYIAG
jgi:diguanylate cyclase (GGDEF)-like protein